jgi:hypothetical protein
MRQQSSTFGGASYQREGGRAPISVGPAGNSNVGMVSAGGGYTTNSYGMNSNINTMNGSNMGGQQPGGSRIMKSDRFEYEERLHQQHPRLSGGSGGMMPPGGINNVGGGFVRASLRGSMIGGGNIPSIAAGGMMRGGAGRGQAMMRY